MCIPSTFDTDREASARCPLEACRRSDKHIIESEGRSGEREWRGEEIRAVSPPARRVRGGLRTATSKTATFWNGVRGGGELSCQSRQLWETLAKQVTDGAVPLDANEASNYFRQSVQVDTAVGRIDSLPCLQSEELRRNRWVVSHGKAICVCVCVCVCVCECRWACMCVCMSLRKHAIVGHLCCLAIGVPDGKCVSW